MKQAAWPTSWPTMAEDDVSRGGAPERTLREMWFSNNVDFTPQGVTLPAVTEEWEIEPSLIQLLPKFSDLSKENPCRHLQDFEMVCGTIRAEGPKMECIRLILFPLSLHNGAREWFYSLPKGSVKTWGMMQQKFLERFYPISRIMKARNEIHTLQMGTAESLYDYWARFKDILAKCPLHQLPDQDLVYSFICGLRAFELRLINVACGGSILDKSPGEALKILEEMAKVFDEEGFIVPKASLNASCPTSLAQEDEINELPKILKVEEHPPSLKAVSIEDNSEQIVVDVLPKIEDKPMGKVVSKEMPKTSDAKVVHNKRKKLLPMEFQGNWRLSKSHQNFVWDPGGQDAHIDEQVK